MKQTIHIKRAYEQASAEDGFRVYIDRLWPRGLSHQTFHYDLWDKEIAPSTELREWFHQNPDSRWKEFEIKYQEELLASQAFAQFKQQISDKSTVTLLYSSHDTLHNNAHIVKSLIESES